MAKRACKNVWNGRVKLFVRVDHIFDYHPAEGAERVGIVASLCEKLMAEILPGPYRLIVIRKREVTIVGVVLAGVEEKAKQSLVVRGGF